jgi:leader peptidase (prepilin peptidase)/N-methyltransferase
MLAPLLFFLVGIPVGLLVATLIARLTETGSEEALAWKVLPWQAGQPATVLRVGAAAVVPPLMAAAAARFDPGAALVASVLLIALVVCAATDLLRYRVPNAVTYPGISLSLLAALTIPGGDFLGSVLGALLSAFLFILVWAATRGGMGMADVKMAVLIGAAFGLPKAYLALVLGVALGGAVMLALLIAGTVHRRQVTPYAPFLSVGAIAVLFLQGTAFTP